MPRRAVYAVFASLLIAFAAFADAGARDLGTVQADIVEDYPAVRHMEGAALTARAPDALLFDVREADEFAVSHLAGARRLDPDMDAEDFIAEFGALIAGRDVVFYCSVGVRSARMAARLANALAPAQSVWNLEGGIFAWHNAARPLRNAGGPTDFVHPYNRSWGRLVDRTSLTRTAP